MGVGGNFWDFLRPYVKQEGPNAVRDKRVAIDLSFWIVQQQTAVANADSYIRKPHLRLTFFRTINLFAKYGAYPVFVVDGTPSHLKSQARVARFSRFSGFDATSVAVAEEGIPIERNKAFLNLVQDCSELVSLFGMPLLKANGEAEGLCAQLNREGHVDACITADSDAFLYGAQCVIKSINPDSKEPFECYYMTDVEAGLKLKRNHLIAVSILVGNDHNLKGVPGIGLDAALRFARIFGDDEILNILHGIRDGGDFHCGASTAVHGSDFSLSERNISPKPSHCAFCGHPGNKRAHKRSSCEYCGAANGDSCKKKCQGFKCPCPYCEEHQKAKTKQKLKDFQLNVCNKIRLVSFFPIVEMTELYHCNSHGNYSDGDPCLSWSCPNIDMLVDFLGFHLHFEPSYVRQKMFPVLSTIFLRNKAVDTGEILLYDQYKFHSIQRIKVQYGNECFIAKWKKAAHCIGKSSIAIDVEDSDVLETRSKSDEAEEGDKDVNVITEENGLFLLTEENMDLVSNAFPEEVYEFFKQKEEKELNRKKAKSSNQQKEFGESPSSGVQLQITEFYRSIKVTKSLKQCEAASRDSANKRRDISEATSRLPKSTRRRLLFN